MRRNSLLLATLTACIAMGCSRSLDSSRAEWQKLESSAMGKVQRAEYPEAEKEYELAIAKAELLTDQQPLVKTLLDLSNLHSRSGQSEKSRVYLIRAHDIGQKQLKSPSLANSEFWQVSTARSAYQLANSYRDQGDFPQAEAFYRLASQHIKDCNTTEANDLASVIADDYRRMDTNRRSADAQIDDMLSKGRQAGDDARTKSNAAFNRLWKKSERLENNNSPEAEKLLLKVLAKAKATYGIRERKYRWTLERLFKHYCRTHEFEKANELFEADLRELAPAEHITKEQLEKDPECLADLHHLTVTLSRLADLAASLNRPDKALEYTIRATRLREKWGPRDLVYANMLRTAGNELVALDRPEEAMKYLDKSLRALDHIESRSSTLESQSVRFHSKLLAAQIEARQGSVKEAEKHFREIRNSFSNLFRAEPNFLAIALFDSTELAYKQSKFPDQKKCIAELMKLLDRQPSLGPEYSFRAYRWSGLYHLANLEYIASLADFKQALLEANKTKLDSYIIDALRWCAEVEKRMQNFDESEKNLLLALQRAESSKNWLAAIDAALCMGVYKSGRGQIEGAERYYRKALDWSERYYPDKPNPRWTALANYADFHRRLGDTDIAFDTMNSAMTLAEKNKSTRPDLVVQAYISLGGLWSDRGDQTEARKYLAKAKLAYRDESMVDHPLLFRLYEVWAHSYWLERNDAKAVPLYSQAIAQFRLTDSRPSYLILLVDEEIANRNNLRRILGYDGLTHQRLLKIAKLHPNNFSNRNHAASSIKHLSFLCTLDNRPADAANIDKIACEIRDNRKK